MTNTKHNSRNSSIELMRIIIMLFIIIHHFILSPYTGFNFKSIIDNEVITDDKILLSFIECVVVIGVNCFFILSGYFHIHFGYKKIAVLIIDFYIFNMIIRVTGLLLARDSISYQFIKSIAYPFGDYWYICVYTALLFFTPVLNIISDNIDFRTWIGFCISYLGILGIWPLIFTTPLGDNKGYSLICAAGLYLVGSGLNKFQVHISHAFMKYIVCCLVNWIITIVFMKVFHKGSFAWEVYSYNNPIVVIESVLFFLIFTQKNNFTERYTSIICKLSRANLGVYYIHTCKWIVVIMFTPISYIYVHSFWGAVLFSILYAIFCYLICNRIYWLYLLFFSGVILKTAVMTEKIFTKVSSLAIHYMFWKKDNNNKEKA